MTLYEYKCPHCNTHVTSEIRDNRLHRFCHTCNHFTLHRRVFGFSMQPIMHEHFNHTTMQPVSDMRKFKDQLKVASEQATLETGIEHNYVPDDGSPQAAGATGEGIYESNQYRSKHNLPLLPEIEPT